MRIRKSWPRRLRGNFGKGAPLPNLQSDPPTSVDARYVNAYFRQAGIALGDDTVPAAAADVPFDPELAQGAALAARKNRAHAMFARAVAQGRPLEAALLEAVYALLRMGEAHSARALAMGAGSIPGGERARRLATGLGAHRRKCIGFAWQQLRELSDEDLASFLPVPSVEVALAVGEDDSLGRARAIASKLELLSDPAVLDLAGRFLAVGDKTTAEALWAEAERRGASELDEEHHRTRTVLNDWFERGEAGALEPGSVPIGLLDHRRPDEDGRSRSIGDYTQTLAMLGNLARLESVTFTGEAGLAALAGELQRGVRPELRRTDVTGRLQLVPVTRDFSSGDDIPPGTWTFVFGKHSRQLFNLRYDFPYHPNVRPVFVSFDIEQVEMLTPGAISYLREHGPIGCRNWTTVYLLLSAGVDAFFAGCLTTTVDAVASPRNSEEPESSAVAVVDLPRNAVAKGVRRHAEHMSESSEELGGVGLADGIRVAWSRIASFQGRFRRVVTSRLDTYLSATSVGVPVRYRPRFEGDVHHDGLSNLRSGTPELQAVQDGIRGLLDGVVGLIASGADESAVYARWREMTEDLVRQARERMSAPARDQELRIDLADALQVITAESRRYGPHSEVDPDAVTDVALSLDQNLKSYLPVTVESMLANASGSVRLWITCRGLDAAYQRWLANAFPNVAMTFLPFDHVDYGDVRHLAKRITMTTLDRLLLPDVLRDIDRIVYLDIDTVTVGDVCTLAKTDLMGTPLAAISRNVSATRIWRAASTLLDAEKASELRRRLCEAYAFDYPSLNAGVLVLDLYRMRADNFTATYLPWVERYGLNDQDVLIGYVGPNRAVLEPKWNFRPFVEDLEDPAIIHYAHGGKPWFADLCPYQVEWQHYNEKFRVRAGRPPV